MIYEVAQLAIDPADAKAFEAAVAKAVPLFQRAPGCLSMRLDRVVEMPGVYRLVVGWASVEAHTVDFRGSPDFAEWRGLVGGFFASSPDVVHTATAVKGF